MSDTKDITSKKHPKALPFLFFTEMWERFGYYLMLGIFVLYMIDVQKGGLGIPDKMADDVFGTFIAFTYLTPFLGGFLADRKFGYIGMFKMLQTYGKYYQSYYHTYAGCSKGSRPAIFITHEGSEYRPEKGTDVDTHVEQVVSTIFLGLVFGF